MNRLLLSGILAAAACSTAPQSTSPAAGAPTQTVIAAQGNEASTPPTATGCPNIQIKAPDSVPAGQSARITTIMDRTGAGTFNWSVSNGKIQSGQGTAAINIDTTGLAGINVTATVELGGLPDAHRERIGPRRSVVTVGEARHHRQRPTLSSRFR
jgi:PKD-like domain